MMFIVVIVLATIMVIGVYLNTDGQVKIAQAAQGVASSNTQTAEAISHMDERWGLLIQRLDKLLDKYGITAASLNLTNITVTAPPA